MTYYKRDGAVVRVILRTEFCGRTYAVLQGVDEYDHPNVHAFDASVLDGCPKATAEEWAEAEARAVKRQREVTLTDREAARLGVPPGPRRASVREERCEVAGRILCIETDAGLIIRRIDDSETSTKTEDA